MITADIAARKILDGAARDRALIIFPFYVKVLRWMDRHAGFLLRLVYRNVLRDYRKLLTED